MRLNRWALHLQQYNYSVEYLKGKYNRIADTLSRAPAGLKESEYYVGNVYFQLA